MLSLWWSASAQLHSGFNEMSALSRRCTCAVQYGIHLNKSRLSQLQQTHCIQISSEPITENAQEITIDPWKWNKKQHASFHTCCAHARGVSRIFSALSESKTARLITSNDASIVKHGQCCRSLINSNRSKQVEWTLGTTRQVLERQLFSSGECQGKSARVVARILSRLLRNLPWSSQ